MRRENGYCPRCGHNEYWEIRRNRYKCCKCKREYSSSWGKTGIPDETWKLIVVCFLKGLTLSQGLRRTSIGRHQYLNAMREIRELMLSRLSSEAESWLTKEEFYNKVYWVLHMDFDGTKTEVVMPMDYDHTTFCEAEMCRRIALLPDDKLPVFKQMIQDRDKWGFKKPILVFKNKRYALHLLVDDDDAEDPRDNEDEIEENYTKAGLDLQKKLVGRKGIDSANLKYYLAEILWKHRHRNKQRSTKINMIEQMFVASRPHATEQK